MTATFPYIVLLILLVRNLLLPGAWKGIKFYIIPEWERLAEAKVSDIPLYSSVTLAGEKSACYTRDIEGILHGNGILYHIR